MTGKCNDCDFIQSRGNDPRCLVCIYFNRAIFNTNPITIDRHDSFRINSTMDDTPKKVEKTNILKEQKSIDETEITFLQLIKDKSEYWKTIGLDIKSTFGFNVDEEISDNESKDYFYFIFPNSIKFKNKYIRAYGTSKSTKNFIETNYEEDYKQYSSIEWNTPNKYTHCKPCDCYEPWI